MCIGNVRRLNKRFCNQRCERGKFCSCQLQLIKTEMKMKRPSSPDDVVSVTAPRWRSTPSGKLNTIVGNARPSTTHSPERVQRRLILAPRRESFAALGRQAVPILRTAVQGRFHHNSIENQPDDIVAGYRAKARRWRCRKAASYPINHAGQGTVTRQSLILAGACSAAQPRIETDRR